MGIKTYNPYTPSRRNMTGSDFSEITKKTPEKSLLKLPRRHPRNHSVSQWRRQQDVTIRVR